MTPDGDPEFKLAEVEIEKKENLNLSGEGDFEEK